MRVAAFQHYGRIHISQIFGPHHVALEPLGAWHWCQHIPTCTKGQPRLWPECQSTTVWRDVLSKSQLPQQTKKLFKQVLLKKIGKNTFCVQYTVLTQTRGLVSLDLLCFHSFWSVTITEISIYILKDTHIEVF